MIGLGIAAPGRDCHGLPTGKTMLIGSCLLAALSGCAAAPIITGDEHRSITALASKVQSLEYQVLATQVAISNLGEEQHTTQQALTDQITALTGQMEGMPDAVSAKCGAMAMPANTAPENEQPAQPVVMGGDKMVVGELERVWIDPPGANLIARVDTGADSSSLHAENLVEFERDGDDWVRFDLVLNDQIITLERPVIRYVRVYQQTDVEGSRRPVVAMRLRLGDVKDTFEFTLADRAHLDFQMLLGRNFLSDMALVDVGKQFIQPPYKPKRKK